MKILTEHGRATAQRQRDHYKAQADRKEKIGTALRSAAVLRDAAAYRGLVAKLDQAIAYSVANLDLVRQDNATYRREQSAWERKFFSALKDGRVFECVDMFKAAIGIE